jgi:hypothetical protein
MFEGLLGAATAAQHSMFGAMQSGVIDQLLPQSCDLRAFGQEVIVAF